MNMGRSSFWMWLFGSMIWAGVTFNAWKHYEALAKTRLEQSLPAELPPIGDIIWLVIFIVVPIVGVYLFGRVIESMLNGFRDRDEQD